MDESYILQSTKFHMTQTQQLAYTRGRRTDQTARTVIRQVGGRRVVRLHVLRLVLEVQPAEVEDDHRRVAVRKVLGEDDLRRRYVHLEIPPPRFDLNHGRTIVAPI